ncbi:MAG: urate hydroxylase PuuD [Gammaproteobacteria bacterium]|nr:urate hydroxylase PuuD [Gammaproteobacteria bacterium]MDH3372405.1 urate hydroxylase PuuD [Gammaproteobacteria bacterium]MDH3409026.1 urate hydroxylase PuuD [Gammaproteobacteria bacterium]MDH3551460.1 urate hydroxylase PuuD [Gammaproteobacteria bacterium]
MEAYVVDWLNLLARWLHFITGIAWIGSSFYFIWLDNHLEPPTQPGDAEKGVAGEVWSVHGGGFYHARKYQLAPQALPETLHWFKWEAYWTWLSGMFLLILIYWYGAQVYLIDPSVAGLSSLQAIGIAAGSIVGGWFVYDLLCKTRLGDDDRLLGAVLLLFVAALAWGLCHLFSGRGAYIHFGAVLGTIMVANVFFVIIPGQRKMVDAHASGSIPDPQPGLQAKQRSVHNTYFTLPVLFVMTSNHFAMTYNHEYSWAILVAMSLAGALIRAYFVARHKGKASLVPLAVAALLLAGVAAFVAPRASAASGESVDFDDVRSVVHSRCTTCHSDAPAHPAFPAAPGGVILDTDAQIVTEALRIHQQTVVTRVMPIGNLTGISEEEREIINRWYQAVREN